MKQNIFFKALVLALLVGFHTNIFAQNNYRHSVGANLSWMNGISFKFNLKGNVYLQTDWGMGINTNVLFPVINELYFCPDLGGQVNILYERKFSKTANTYWIVGGGICGAKDWSKGLTSPYWKTGAKVVLGLEWCFDIPMSIQLDMRHGYGLMFSANKNFDGGENLLFTINHVPFHFYDFSMVFSIRYCFDKIK